MPYSHQQYMQRGFTLLELLVVIVIIAVLSSVATLAIRNDSTRQLKEEAQRLRALVDLASQEAILNAQEMALEIDGNSYTFLLWDAAANEWMQAEESGPLRMRELPEEMELSVVIEGVFAKDDDEAGDEETPKERVWILSSGEMSPFSLDIKLQDGPVYTLEGDIMGGLTLIEPEAES